MKTKNIDVDMNHLPEYVRDVFEEVSESCCYDYELVNIEHSMLFDDNGTFDSEFWDIAFYEKSVMDWLCMVQITYQPWNPMPLNKKYMTIPMRRIETIMNKVRDIRNGKHEHL